MPLLGFQMPLELFAEASLKNFYMLFQWWQTVLLECDSNLANSCCVIEKKLIFWKVFFCKFSLFSSYLFAGGSENKLFLHKQQLAPGIPIDC